MKHLPDDVLDGSDVVANCRMNRDRRLSGSNSYEKELGFQPLQFLRSLHGSQESIRWLDLCCGSGKALIEAAAIVEADGTRIEIVGVDLAGMFLPPVGRLQLVQASLRDWRPEDRFDLITCVHGLHYLGDKLGLLQRAGGWLKDRGRFVGHLDLDNLRWEDDSLAGPTVVSKMRRMGMSYSTRTRRLQFGPSRKISFPYTYLGADDQAGPNYTNQPAVNSYYQRPVP